MKQFSIVARIFVLLFVAQIAWAQPYGLTTPQAVGPYLNNVFPATAPTVSASYATEIAFTNLTIDQPMFLMPYPGTNKLLVIRKPGQIVLFENRASVSNAEVQVFMDLQPQVFTLSDCGMTGIAFHPEFGQPGSSNRNYIYVTYKWRPDNTGFSEYAYWRMSRFTVPDGTMTVNTNSEVVMIQQLDRQMWHDAGSLFFGLDGFLYFSIGDEGGSNDQYNDTQHMDDRLFSGVFRIDVNKNGATSHAIRRQPARHIDTPASWPDPLTTNYFVPDSNPFVNTNGSTLEEFMALGFRQPYRFSQDLVTGWIWIGDSGQSTREELDILTPGANYQWAYREGSVAGPKATPTNILGSEKLPIWDYDRAYGGCFIGGYVYRGALLPQLVGKYICADNVSGRVTAVTYDGTNAVADNIANMPSGSVYGGTSSCGLDANGEIYFLKFGDVGAGRIYRLAQSLSVIPDPPALLSQVGAFSNMTTLASGPGLLPYTVNSPLWSDNAAKSRWLAVPNDGTHNTANELITFSPTNEWNFPTGTVFMKHFELPVDDANPSVRQRLETRFLIMDQNGGSYGVTYKWRADNSDADLLTNGLSANYVITNIDTTTRTQVWAFPSRQDCLTCHNANAKSVLGLKTHQLNCDLLYPQTGTTDNQLRALGHIGLFTSPYSEASVTNYLKSYAVTNTAVPLETRVRSYIDANCSQCHRPGGVRANFDARYTRPLEEQGIIYGALDSFINGPEDRVVKPGDVLHSLMHNRPNRVGALQMPPLAKNVVDQSAMNTISNWIVSLPPGPGVTLAMANTNQAIVAGAFTVNITFTESVTGLTTNDFVIGNGSITSLTGAGLSYTVVIQPGVQGVVTVRLPAGVVINGSSVVNYGSNTLTIQYDPLAAYLTTWLPFDEGAGTNTADATGNGNNGGLNNFGGAQWITGTNGAALDFDGINDYVGINNIVSSNFTIACWLRTTQVFQTVDPTYQGTGIIWSDVGGTANDFILGGTRSAGGINRLSFFTGNPDTSLNGVTPINTGNWIHVAATRNASTGQMKIYVNGVLDGTGVTGTAPLTANPRINIGGNTLDGRYFQGAIDDVRIYSRVLTDVEVAALLPPLPPPPPPPAPTPVAWYKFETNALDSTTNLYHGTLTNVPYVIGRVDAFAGQFNGTNSYVVIPASIRSNFTISAWVKTTNTAASGQWNAGRGIVDGDVSGVTTDFGTSLVSNKFAFGVGNPNTTITSTNIINNGQWRHVAATRDSASGAMKIYVDGVLDTSATGPTGVRAAPPVLRIGSLQSGSGLFIGAIDDVRLYDSVLTSTQIVALATNALPNTAPTLGAISNQTLMAGATLVVTNIATDPDVPAQTITFSLLSSPGGANINASNGLITWRPTVAQSPSTNTLMVQATDSGSPNLTASNSFIVTVLRPAQPTLSAATLSNGTFGLTIAGNVGPDYSIYASTNLLNWNLLLMTNPSALPINFTDPGATNYTLRFYRVLLGP